MSRHVFFFRENQWLGPSSMAVLHYSCAALSRALTPLQLQGACIVPPKRLQMLCAALSFALVSLGNSPLGSPINIHYSNIPSTVYARVGLLVWIDCLIVHVPAPAEYFTILLSTSCTTYTLGRSGQVPPRSLSIVSGISTLCGGCN